MSLLAYADPGFALNKFRNANLTVDDNQPFSSGSTQCYIVYTDAFVIVGFRGTQVLKPGIGQSLGQMIKAALDDDVLDLRFRLVGFDGGGSVHEGFKSGLDAIWESRLKPRLDELKQQKPERRIWFTGHSLGAALATLAAARYKDVQGLYTFGSPLVGDSDFKSAFPSDIPVYRFVNNNDVVATVPPVGLYQQLVPRLGRYEHIGHLKYIESDGAIIDDPGKLEQLIQGVRGQISHLVDSITQLRQGFKLQLPDEKLNDHGPIYYSIRVWNYYEKSPGFLLEAET